VVLNIRRRTRVEYIDIWK